MAEPPPPSLSPAQTPPAHQQATPAAGGREDMLACVAALEAALLPCLPARSFQAVDRSLQSSHQIDVEIHARDFMEAAKKLQSYFISLQREDQPRTEEMLRKEITTMEEELKTNSEFIAKHKKLIEGWQKELKEQLGKHITKLERV
ncbi:mediator of RNA polymerase II transcription subunit 28-like [Phragmites australis]|uniref:mediator of RNA polymerase II transcription subunit 28-like n=1 Tax=Phragmites australis TaxID=29695 RepID=UPI002D77C318|nr:mediator of RNA polymerase II transcription subunit 28-like [Phragmites australis]